MLGLSFVGRIILLSGPSFCEQAGATKDFVTALNPFGLQPDNPAFWADALEAHLGGLMNEAEILAKELGYA